MHELAEFIEFAIVPPSVMAARAIAPPTIARINAYSAAAAPESSYINGANLTVDGGVNA